MDDSWIREDKVRVPGGRGREGCQQVKKERESAKGGRNRGSEGKIMVAKVPVGRKGEPE